MPSAEKTSSAAVKLESIQQNETKMMENVQKESSAESGTTLFALNQIVSMISNKVRNLEKRKVSSQKSTASSLSRQWLTRRARVGVDFRYFAISSSLFSQYGVRRERKKRASERKERKNLPIECVCFLTCVHLAPLRLSIMKSHSNTPFSLYIVEQTRRLQEGGGRWPRAQLRAAEGDIEVRRGHPAARTRQGSLKADRRNGPQRQQRCKT